VFIMHGTRKNREFYLRVWRSSFLSFFFQCKIKSFYRLLWRTHRCQFERTTRNKQIKISSFSDFNEWMELKNIWKHQYIVRVQHTWETCPLTPTNAQYSCICLREDYFSFVQKIK
jgi:hypothetical protein